MTAEGELYVDEECRDAFKDKLDKWFGKDNWNLVGSEYSGYGSLSEMPDKMIVDVEDVDEGKPLGKVEIKNKFEIEEDMGGRYITCVPKSIKLIGKVKNH